jgi:hypothetical protein
MAGILDEFARSFDSEEEPATAEAAAEAVVNALDDDDIDEELSEAEKRLAKAAYYKAIVRGGVVEEDGTPQAAEVNAEARVWARQMMGKLLGIAREQAPVKVESPFTPNEVTALKKLAGFALAKMGELPAEPQVKMVEAPKTPTLRKIQAQQQQPAPRTAPPAPSKPQPGPGKTATAGKGKKPPKAKPGADGTVNYDSIPSKTPFTDTDGQIYKFVDNPNYDPDKKGSKPRTKLKVTNQVRGVGAMPTPNKAQMEAITASQSMEAVNSGVSASASSPFGAGKDEDKVQGLFVAGAAHALKE